MMNSMLIFVDTKCTNVEIIRKPCHSIPLRDVFCLFQTRLTGYFPSYRDFADLLFYFG